MDYLTNLFSEIIYIIKTRLLFVCPDCIKVEELKLNSISYAQECLDHGAMQLAGHMIETLKIRYFLE